MRHDWLAQLWVRQHSHCQSQKLNEVALQILDGLEHRKIPRYADRWILWARSRLQGHCHLSAVFQSEIVVHGMADFLLAAEIPLGCLNRCVAKEKLNLLKFSACEMA